jgi:hypothetical protein
MNRHATAEELSAYLDQELEPPRLRLVRGHLEACEDCRRRADGLARVVRDLRALERQAPPPVLGQHLLERVHRQPRPRTLVEKLEGRLTTIPSQSSITFLFALVLAFAVLMYVFSGLLDRHERNQTSILRPPLPPPVVEVAGRSFEPWQGGWRQTNLDRTQKPLPVAAEDPAGAELLARYPDLEELLRTARWVLLQDGDRTVRLLAATPRPAAAQLPE